MGITKRGSRSVTIDNGFLRTALALNSTNQVVKDQLGNSSLFNLGTQYTGWANALAGLINDVTKDSLSIFKTTTAGGTSNGYKFLVNGLGKMGIGNLGGSYSPVASLDIVGEGATVATTSLLVKNGAGTQLFKINDDGQVRVSANNFIAPGILNNSMSTTSNQGGNGLNEFIRGYNNNGTNSFGFTNMTIGGGFYLQSMTTAQRNSITPIKNLLVFDSDLNTFCFYNVGTASWRQISNSAA